MNKRAPELLHKRPIVTAAHWRTMSLKIMAIGMRY
jgi:hypothetical protein